MLFKKKYKKRTRKSNVVVSQIATGNNIQNSVINQSIGGIPDSESSIRCSNAEVTAILQHLADMDDAQMIGLAYLYALNYKKYGVDVTEAWTTATQQAAALEIAYYRGIQDAMEGYHERKTNGKEAES